MIKKLLLALFLGVFNFSYSQIMSGEYAMYMFSGRYSNPALSGVKEFGSSLLYQSQHSRTKKSMWGKNPLISHQLEFGQSVFAGRGGFELQWNHSDYWLSTHRNSGSLSYSHGIELGKKLILRFGLSGRINSHVFLDSSGWNNHVGNEFKPGYDLELCWDAGISLHHKSFYAALGGFRMIPHTFQEETGLGPFTPDPVFTTEAGGVFHLGLKKYEKWAWSLQPFVRASFFRHSVSLNYGAFVNYGPLQFGMMMQSNEGVRPSIGLNTSLLRVTYSYFATFMSFNKINYYTSAPNHEIALRFILPGRNEEANFMKSVYRGF